MVRPRSHAGHERGGLRAVRRPARGVLRRLGEPLFIEDFDLPNIVFTIFSDGTEAEFWFASERRLDVLGSGAFRILLDKTGILAGVVFPTPSADPVAQTETLRRMSYWFWHDLSHFIAAVGRGHIGWARGQLDVLRGICVNLARLRRDFSDGDAGDEPYEKVDLALPGEDLSTLEATLAPWHGNRCSGPLRLSSNSTGMSLLRWQTHGIRYPAELERMMSERLHGVTVARRQEASDIGLRKGWA